MLSCFKKKKKIAKGLDHTVLISSCGPTSVLAIHGINKKSSFLGIKNRFSSRFPIFTIRPPGPVRFWKPRLWGFSLPQVSTCHFPYQKIKKKKVPLPFLGTLREDNLGWIFLVMHNLNNGPSLLDLILWFSSHPHLFSLFFVSLETWS